jgi:hypothetical protein
MGEREVDFFIKQYISANPPTPLALLIRKEELDNALILKE